MTAAATVTGIWRYPIKAIGAEPLDTVTLSAGRPLPLDRAWAVLEEGRAPSDGWQRCINFLRGAKGPGLMAVGARVEGEVLHLTHPDRPALSLTLSPQAGAALLEWLAPIYPADRPRGTALVKAPDEGLADAPFASVSVMNLASLRALSQKAGRDLDLRRFRGNIWLDGLAPWEEFDLIGRTLAIGPARLEVKEPIVRCRSTEANPDTGQRDTPTLQILQDGWGHTDFGVNTSVTTGGDIAIDDPVSIA